MNLDAAQRERNCDASGADAELSARRPFASGARNSTAANASFRKIS